MSAKPATLVIFGASGDLTARKLIPSLYNLDRKGRLPEQLQIVGVSRSEFSDEAYVAKVAPWAKEFVKGEYSADSWAKFAKRLHYVAGDAGSAAGLEKLKAWLQKAEGDAGDRLYYLSVKPELYGPITTVMSQAGMASEEKGWRRLIIEKPFGHDRASAKALNKALAANFEEGQIYRIDHYLGKETVQNLLVFRFANTLFEPLWNTQYIDHVQITVTETVDVADRADYYDHSSVLRDMFQNHILQLLTIVAMEAPAKFAADQLRNEKVKVLDAIPIYTAEEAPEHIVAAQYDGYLGHKGVAAGSRTPTFSTIQLSIDNWRWQGVPFFLRSGKAMDRRLSEVVVQFRCPPHMMFPLPKGTIMECNRLSIAVQPDEGIHIQFQSKVPDQIRMQLRPSSMDFSYKKEYPDTPIPEAYERLLQDALGGDASLFMRSDEIERAWEVMDPLIQCIEDKGGPPLSSYKKGTAGPASADEFLAKTGRKWLSLSHK